MKWSVVLFGIITILNVNRVFAEGEILPEAARVGVGVGVGKYQVEESLMPGGVYRLRSLPVINTGLSDGEFEVTAELKKGPVLAENANVASWFEFQPSRFHLVSEEVMSTAVSLALPFSVPPGDYLVYLVATQPRNSGSKITLSPAAAAKLYFTVRPASVLGAYRARFLTFLELNPKAYLILAAILFVEAGLILRRHYRLRFEKK
jgi:hypothetical protein